jgi:putative transposase
MTETLLALPESIPVARACDALGFSRATLYRHTWLPAPRAPRLGPPPARALNEHARREILDKLHSSRFVDQPPAEVYATLLSEGLYLCSVRTMYRILHTHGETTERRAVRRPAKHPIPSVTATAPNQVWTWDITKMAGPSAGVFFFLYCILDLFSRYPVGWIVATQESAKLACQFVFDTVATWGLEKTDLIVHCDRGSPMTSTSMATLCDKLGIVQSFSRPRVSDDNPFSEAHFKTMKYQPDYPARMESPESARSWCNDFMLWYGHHHHHKNLALFTPADVYFGRVDQVARQRQQALDEAHARHPERFVHGPPRLARPPSSVSINPPTVMTSSAT